MPSLLSPDLCLLTPVSGVDLISKVYSIAQKARNWAEDYAKTNSISSDLCGLCAIASGELWRRLYDQRIYSAIAGSEYHFFNILLNEKDTWTILDITATQFGDRPIVMLNADDTDKFYWSILDVFYSDREVLSYQQCYNWPEWQVIKVTGDREQESVVRN
jgi:hypothetical protein